MRIRTVKPEFWTNEKMARMPDFTRLLALALLNYSDDHGYFWANPLMIRGAVFPFEEDSGRILHSLHELSSLGFLRLGETQDGRKLGQVVKFSVHQKVEKPKESAIEPLATFPEKSTTNRGGVGEASALDRNREQGKDTLGTAKPAPASDSEWLQSLRTDPAYEGIDVDREFSKARVWCDTNHKELTHRRFVNWLNRVDRPVGGNGSAPDPQAHRNVQILYADAPAAE